MARKKVVKDERVVGTPNDDFKGFIKHNLTSEEKERFVAWVEERVPMDWFEFAHEMADSGYVVSIKFDDYNKTHQASMTCKSAVSENYGFVLVARAPDSYRAAFLLMFKHQVLMAGDWLAFHFRGQEEAGWG